jgi:PAS domain S-box-containing protein
MAKANAGSVLGRPTVLTVDDNEANQLALEAVLEQECDLVRADSGAEAVSVMEERSDIDVVLLDVHMPEMDGFQTAARIKKIEGYQDIPIVFITAVYKEDPYIKQGYQVGGIDYFSKPFDPDILKLKISIYASFRHRAKILRERERQVRESEELLRVGRKLASVLESLPVGVLIADVGGRICQATEEVSRILKADESMDGESYGDMLAWWDGGGHPLKDLDGALTLALRDGEASHSKSIQILCLDGSTSTILASTSPLRGVNGKIVGAVILIQDLTEPKKLEADFEQRVVRLIGLGVELEQSAPRKPDGPSATIS